MVLHIQIIVRVIVICISNEHIDLYNTKLISSCLKQTLTPTLALVTLTGTKSPEEVDRAKEALVEEAVAVAEAITKTTQSLNFCLKGK